MYSLGVHHDGAEKATMKCDSKINIMSPSIGAGKVAFSKCSAHDMRQHFRSLNDDCFIDDKSIEVEPGYELEPLEVEEIKNWPGYKFSPDQQCKFAYGNAYIADYAASVSKKIKIMVQTINKLCFQDNICNMLWCKHNFWSIRANPALPGSACSEQFKELRCNQYGQCVKI